MFSRFKKAITIAKAKIGNHSNNNQINQNCNVSNIFVGSSQQDVLNVLKDYKDYSRIQLLSQQFFDTAKQTHPLYPSYSAKFDPNLGRLVSTPETEEALKRYPKSAKGTAEFDYKKYPNMSKDETPWEYAYRTQTKLILKATSYQEYLGDEKDPFPTIEYQDGLLLGIEPPPFPPAVLAQVKCGDVSIPIMLRRVPCEQYKFLCFENQNPIASLDIRISIQQETNKTDITFTRKYDCDLGKQLLREKLICNLTQNRLIIEIDSSEFLNTAIDKKAFQTDFFKSAKIFVKVIEELLFIEEKLSCKFSSKLSTVNDEDYFLILLLSASLHKKWFVQHLSFDNSIRCSYQVLSDTVFKDRTDQEELIGNTPDFSFCILGVTFIADNYTVRLRKARLNNEKSVRKNIKRKKEDILLTFKPSHGNDSFEKYSLLENIKVIEED